ncbi:MAG: hypothetical protein ACQEXX_08745 [Bacillota bacterium]
MTQRQFVFLWSFFISLLSIYAVVRLQWNWLGTLDIWGTQHQGGWLLERFQLLGHPYVFLIIQPIVLFALHGCLHWLIYKKCVYDFATRRMSLLLLLPKRDSLLMNVFRVLLYTVLGGLLAFSQSINGPAPSTVIVFLIVLQYGWWVLEWGKDAWHKASQD